MRGIKPGEWLAIGAVLALIVAGILWRGVKAMVWFNAIGLNVTYWQAVGLEVGGVLLVVGAAVALIWLQSRH